MTLRSFFKTRPRLHIVFALFLAVAIFAPVYASEAPQIVGNTSNASFSKAKKLLQRYVYPKGGRTFYCDSKFYPDKHIEHDTGMVPRSKSKRSKRLEWEHVVPAQWFGQRFSEWRVGAPICKDKRGKPFKGRNCARKASKTFRLMEADMYNLYPSIGSVNQARSNYRYAILDKESREFGACDFEVKDRRVEPRPEIRGNIARTVFYMAAAYGTNGILSRKSVKMYQAWQRSDPVDAEECRRTERIERLQGNENPYVKIPCLQLGFWAQ